MKHVDSWPVSKQAIVLSHLFLAVFLLLSISGCGSTKPPQANPKAKQEFPSWYMTPPQDNSAFMHGVAVGKNREEAIRLALADMVSKLGISIQATYQSSEELKYNYATKTVKNQIDASIASILIGNYTVEQSQRVSYNKFAVLVKTDRAAFASHLKENISAKQHDLETRLDATRTENILSQHSARKLIAQDAAALRADIRIIKALDTAYSGKEVLAFVDTAELAFQQVQRTLNFAIRGDESSGPFVEVIQNHLTKAGYKLSKSVNAHTVILSVTTSLNVTAPSSIRIDIFELSAEALNRGERIGGFRESIKLRHNANRVTQSNRAALMFETGLNGKDIYTILGLDN